jgi:hypothetical protein
VKAIDAYSLVNPALKSGVLFYCPYNQFKYAPTIFPSVAVQDKKYSGFYTLITPAIHFHFFTQIIDFL